MVHETILLWPPASAFQRGDGLEIQWSAPGSMAATRNTPAPSSSRSASTASRDAKQTASGLPGLRHVAR